MTADITPVACSACFSDQGLHLDAERNGVYLDSPCPNCGSPMGKKLDLHALEVTAHKFFVWGSLRRFDFGMAPAIQFNAHQHTSIDVAPWLLPDVRLFERLLGVGFFEYDPRLWMIGEIAPLKELQDSSRCAGVIERLLRDYPEISLTAGNLLYRIRVNPAAPADSIEYDGPPDTLVGNGRLDSAGFPVLYSSPDLELCLHECRVTGEDDVFVATLAPTRELRLLDLSALLEEPATVSEFESLDLAVHMLFLAGKCSYEITRGIARAVFTRGFDGMIFPSYFTFLRRGNMPFQTVMGMSVRQIPQSREYERVRPVQNVAFFGRPIWNGAICIKAINKLILRSVGYDFHFGPVFQPR